MTYRTIFVCLALLNFGPGSAGWSNRASGSKIISYVVDPHKQDIRFFWKNESGALFGNIGNLRQYFERRHRKLIFAMNGGMFKSDYSPVGLFIQDGQVVNALDTSSGAGNFYLKPNGVFYLTSAGKAGICPTGDFAGGNGIRYATQSGPMLLVDGHIHPAFRQGSANLNIRNGVGLLPDNRIIFAMSEEPINFYNFADFFKSQGCRNALYLDGFVSKTYLPDEKCEQTDGNLGVIIGVSTADTQ